MKFVLHILLHAEHSTDVLTAALTLNTVRIGFPDAHMINVYTTRRSTPLFDYLEDTKDWGGKIMELNEPDSIVRLRQEHPYCIAKLMSSQAEDNPADYVHVMLDGDLIFMGDVQSHIRQHILANPTQLLIGQYVPVHQACGMQWMDRLHTALMVFPSIPVLSKMIDANPWVTPWTPCNPIAPQLVFSGGHPVFYDTTANLFHLLKRFGHQRVGNLPPQLHSKYVHLLCGSSRSVLEERLEPEHYADLSKRHYLGLTDPTKLLSTNCAFTEYMFDSNKTVQTDL